MILAILTSVVLIYRLVTRISSYARFFVVLFTLQSRFSLRNMRYIVSKLRFLHWFTFTQLSGLVSQSDLIKFLETKNNKPL